MTNPHPHKSPNEGILPLARQLGERLGGEPGCKPIPELLPVETRVSRTSRKDLWPADEWAKMQAIYEGREP